MPKDKYIDIVKRRLWACGYRVARRSREVDGFDLLVDGAVRVLIAVVKTPKEVRRPVEAHGLVMAVVLTATFGRPAVVYQGPDGLATESARRMFGLPARLKDHEKKTRKEGRKEKGGSEEGGTTKG